MKYAKYIDLPNWKEVQQELIDFMYVDYDPTRMWWCYQDVEVADKLPKLHKCFAEAGLDMRMLIFFMASPKDLDCTDHEDDRSIFIHLDAKDDPEYGEDDTTFEPNFAINIPLENCEGSKTFWYEFKDPNADNDAYYPYHGCGGFKHDSVNKIFEFELDKPAILRINVPHGVYNPHSQFRTVATFRFYNDISGLIED